MSPRTRSITILAILLVAVLTVAGAMVWQAVDQSQDRSPSQVAPSDHPASLPAPQTSSPPPGSVRWMPKFRARELQILESPHFTVGYDNQRKNPAWVMYDLDGPIRFPGQEPTRPQTFATDFRTSAHVSHRDYSGSGYDRGHLWPAYAAWSRYGDDAFKGTFLCSNIIPQKHSVNAGIWEELEVEIAGRAGHGGGWAEKWGHLTVINGRFILVNPRSCAQASPSHRPASASCWITKRSVVDTGHWHLRSPMSTEPGGRSRAG